MGLALTRTATSFCREFTKENIGVEIAAGGNRAHDPNEWGEERVDAADHGAGPLASARVMPYVHGNGQPDHEQRPQAGWQARMDCATRELFRLRRGMPGIKRKIKRVQARAIRISVPGWVKIWKR